MNHSLPQSPLAQEDPSLAPAEPWILVFDGDCAVCAGVASRAAEMAPGALGVLPHSYPWVAAVLGERRLSGPVLVENTGRRRVVRGIAMRARLARVVGMRNGLRLHRLVREARDARHAVDEGRRSFILRGAAVAAGLTGLTLLGDVEEADAACTATSCRFWKNICGTSVDGCGCSNPCIGVWRCYSAGGTFCHYKTKCNGCGCGCT